MKKIKQMLAVFVAAISTSAVSCSLKKSQSENNSENSNVLSSLSGDETLNEINNAGGQTIYWLSDYDLNPSADNERSTALALFEDVYGGKIEYIQVNSNALLSTLSERILSGEPVDMVPYVNGVLPNGTANKLFQPLDEYYDILEMDTSLWENMTDVIDMFEYNGSHYVLPYSISNPMLITYSRKMMQEEALDDPYTLYKEGKWNWDTMMDMMETFVSNAPEDAERFGINGWFGRAVINSSGQSVVSCDNGTFSNNIDDPKIEKAGLLMQELSEKNLCAPELENYFPTDRSTLFFASSDWTLGASNALNEEEDLMIVPFPVAPEVEENYISCDFNARMLAENSDKGAAVAAYIKCERLVATQEKYAEIVRQDALTVKKNVSGDIKSFITEEQFDALTLYLDTQNSTPVFDYAYGMGERMFGNGSYNFETRGVMNNIEQALFEADNGIDSWNALHDAVKGTIDEEIGRFNSIG